MKVNPTKRKRAEDYWMRGEFLPASKLIFEGLPKEVRPLWAASILDICRKRFPHIHEVDEVYLLAHDQLHWERARSAFDAVRTLTLAEAKPFPGADLLFRVAEDTAKVIYNCAGGSTPYDFNAGWKIVAALQDVSDFLNDIRFTQEAFQTVMAEDSEG